jgi:PAS domain S-box-containing protein
MFISVDVATQRVTECNKTFLTVTGFSKSEIIDRHVYDLYHPDCLDEARRSFRLFLTKGKTQDLELLLRRADGNVVDVSMNVSAVRGADGELLYSRAVLRDITAKKRAEARIKNQEIVLAHVSRLSMMGEMATGLAHEINQPLAAIAAYAEGAAVRLRNGNVDTHRLAQVVDRISADAHRAGEVIRRLRKFVRKREPDRTQVDLNELVMDVVQFVATDTRQREVTICFDLDDDLPALQADAVEIQQVLLNLVRNGCDAMQETDPANRHLVIRTRSDGQESIEVDVEDRGHGLHESMEDQVFEAFFSSKNEGLGMGLAISRSIIESHGGRIWVTPNLEGGATFHFSLPAAKGVLIDE